MVTMGLLLAALIIFALLPLNTYCSSPTDHRLAQIHTSYKQEKDGCAYDGYDPYRSPEITKMGHIVANLHTTVLQDIYISEGFTKTLGTAGSIQEVADASANILDARGTEHLTNAMKFASKIAKRSLSVLSPVLGILVAVFDAVQGVKTPTHQDILDATNKALKRVTDEVDDKMKEAKKFAENKVNMLEKDINNRKYEFLFKYWTACEGLETEEATDTCQRDSYLMILASIDEFLLFTNKLDTSTGVFSDLTVEEIRRIELGMVSYRNYATLVMLSLKTLAITYDRLREQEKNEISLEDRMGSCEEMNIKIRKQEKRNKKPKGGEKRKMVTLPPKLKYYCFYTEELVAKARYFEMYGKAAIDVMVGDLWTLDYNEEYKTPSRSDEQHIWSNPMQGWRWDLWERRISCNAKLHPSKSVKCSYDISLVEKPDKVDTSNKNMMETIKEKDIYNRPKGYEQEALIQDGELISGGRWRVDMTKASEGTRSETSKWCEAKIQKRYNEYHEWEKADIRRYWTNEVMTVITCGRLLAENIEKDCQPTTMRKHLPLANENAIKFKSSTGGNAERAIDGLLTSVSVSEKEVRPSWMGQFQHPASIKEIYLYIPKLAFFGSEDATVDHLTVDYYPKTKALPVHRYRTWEKDYIFSVIYEGYRYMILTDVNGKKIKGGYTNADANQDYWSATKKWSYEKDYKVNVHGFKKINPSSINQLKVETGVGTNGDDMEWKQCKVKSGLKLSKVLKASEPIKIRCDKPTGVVNALKVTVDEDDEPKILRLAEIRVIGYPEAALQPKTPTEMAVDLDTATQSSWNNQFATSPENAIDNKLTTVSSTEEQPDGKPLWLQVELDEEAAVTAVNVKLSGVYKTVTIAVSKTGKDGGEWTQCGDVGQDVDGYNIKGFERKCEDLKSQVKFARVTAEPKSGKNILKVKEMIVRAPYED